MRYGQMELRRQELYAEIADRLGILRDEVRPEASLRDDLGIDSLDTLELVEALEPAFHIRLDDDEVSMFETVADLERCILRSGGRLFGMHRLGMGRPA